MNATAAAALVLAMAVMLLVTADGSPVAAFPTERTTMVPHSLAEVEVDVSRPDVEFHIHTRLNPVNPRVVDLSSTSFPVDPAHDMVVIVHGFTGSVMSQSVTLIRDALLYTQDITVVGVQWSHLARGPWYDEAAANTVVVSQRIADFLSRLEKKGLDLNQVHIIGFSLGAHVAGFTGSLLAARVGRITGLDPARPGFDNRNSSGRLDLSDAKFVVGVHTGIGFVAMSEPVGHVDFYPNGGQKQPHCQKEEIQLVCNHYMAYTYFAESIYNPEAFPARECKSWHDFENGLCDSNAYVLMGYFTPNSTRGVYYLRTNAQEPYGLGLNNEKTNAKSGQYSSPNSTHPENSAGPQSNQNPPRVGCDHRKDVYCVDGEVDNSDGIDLQTLSDHEEKSNAYNNSMKIHPNKKYFLSFLLLLLISI